VWTWVAIDADTKLGPSYLVGDRSDEDGWAVLTDRASRLTTLPQIATDGLGPIPGSSRAFSVPTWTSPSSTSSTSATPTHKYSPPTYRTVETIIRNGEPDPDHISTS